MRVGMILIFASAEMEDFYQFFASSYRVDPSKIYNDEKCNSCLNKSELYFYNDRFITR